MRKILLLIVTLLLVSCQTEVTDKGGGRRHFNNTKSQDDISITDNETKSDDDIVTKKIQYSYEPAVFKNDSITYWWVLFKVRRKGETLYEMNAVMKQNHSYFSPSEASSYAISQWGYEKAFITNFVQVAEATYISENSD